VLSRSIVSTGVPLFAVRFDDNRGTQRKDVIEFLDRGIPVTLAVNPSTIGSANRLTFADIRFLIGYAQRKGTELAVMHHSATNWTAKRGAATGGDPVGSEFTFADHNFDEYDRAAIVEELDPTLLEQELGVPVTGYITPGTSFALQFTRHRADLIRDVLHDLGFDYALGLVPFNSFGARDYGRTASVFRNTTNWLTEPTDNANFARSVALRPGAFESPFWLPDEWTIDLGTYVVPRGVANGSDAPLPDPNSGAAGWLLGEDNNGDGVEGAAQTDIARTVQYHIARLLGSGSWACLALHSEADSNATSVALSTGTQAYPNSYSLRHLAWLLDALRTAGFVRLGTVDEWAGELYGEFAEGVDLIANPTVAAPLEEVGDVGTGELAIPAGLAPTLDFASVYDVSSVPSGGNIVVNASGQLETAANSVRLYGTVFGPGVATPRGLRGGFKLRPDEDSASAQSLELRWTGLPPGLYELGFHAEQDGTTWRIAEQGSIATRRWHENNANLLTDEAEVVSSEVDFYVPRSSVQFGFIDAHDGYRAQNVTAGQDKHPRYFLDFAPERVIPAIDQTLTTDVASIADGASATFTVDVPGAELGARVRVHRRDGLPTNVTANGVVTAAGVVTVTVSNESGGAVDLSSELYRVYVEDLRQSVPISTASPMTRWSFSTFFNFQKDGLTELRIAEPRLYLLRRY
jgi:hypothetical protein